MKSQKISQRAVEHELQLNCSLFLCFEYTDFFPQYNFKAFNHLMTMQQKMSIETLSIEK